jgi:two-component system heavy metal sensor histidine kinase CusS
VLPRIFDRFSRGDGARSGGVHSGVGLALVRAICEVLGLSASAENGDDGSVRFVLRHRPGARGEGPHGAERRAAASRSLNR